MAACPECDHAKTRALDPQFAEFDCGEFPDMREESPAGAHRCWSKTVEVCQPMPENARIMLSIRLMDCDTVATSNLRYEITAHDIGKESFKIRLMTWDNTRLNKVRVAWAIV
ncbi:H-type lectin domain-containing protein [Qipengyuania flava]|uniref:H-type lectin domain-containing protein n=1 Tax=Qipengyuania flava TaxID=192812 RepID=UPI001C6306D1|nr:H-type lectin domain-containing protein [Qipengyuania flava]QYJ07560.1 H-type lectin domain-containing protein [Qipengyuania flava]